MDDELLAEIAMPQMTLKMYEDSSQALREGDISPEGLEGLIRYCLDELPTQPVLKDDVYPILFQETIVLLGECLRNPVIEKLSPELIHRATDRRVQYFVQCAENALPGTTAWSDPGFAHGKLYCAVAPIWFYLRSGDLLSEETKRRVEALPIKKFFAAGMLEYSQFGSDDKTARSFPIEIANTLEYTGRSSEIDAGLQHLVELAKEDGRDFLIEGIREVFGAQEASY